MTMFRQGKPRARLEDGKKVFDWPLEKRDEGIPMSGWHEVEVYPTRKTCRAALRTFRTEEQVHRARLARA